MILLLTQLQEHLALALFFTGLLGLCVGSFLNVVIHRLPLMMLQAWRQEASWLLSIQADIDPQLSEPIVRQVAKDTPLTLSRPRSHCPHCAHAIPWYENVPLFSWILLRGQCSSCQHPITVRYPLVELLTALLSMTVIYQFGVSLQAGAALVLVWSLIALAGIDFDTQLLPDQLTFPIAGLGLAVNAQSYFVSPTEAIWGLLIGFLSLWVVVKIYYLFSKKQGMGQGDFKLLAMLGAWLGWMMLPLIILLSSLLGSVIGLILLKRHGESKPFAFGPYIAISGIVALLFGNDLMQWYLNMYL